MGAKHSCCAYSSPRYKDILHCSRINSSLMSSLRRTDRGGKKDKSRRNGEGRDSDRYEPRQAGGDLGARVSESCGNLQHISEREPDDWDLDPSLHPTTETMFMEKSKQSIRNGMVRKKSQMMLANSNSMGDFTTLKKASSCSTIYIDDSTVSQPNLKNTIKCVSLAIYYHIKNRNSDAILDIFDERKQPLTREAVPADYDKYNPDHRQIYKFIRTLFNAAQLTAECAIITLVYLERLLTYAEVRSTTCSFVITPFLAGGYRPW